MFTIQGEVVGQPPVVTDDIVQSVDQKICQTALTSLELSSEFLFSTRFPQWGHTNIGLGNIGVHKAQTCLEHYHKGGDKR